MEGPFSTYTFEYKFKIQNYKTRKETNYHEFAETINIRIFSPRISDIEIIGSEINVFKLFKERKEEMENMNKDRCFLKRTSRIEKETEFLGIRNIAIETKIQR